MPMELIDETKEKMTKTLSVLKAELAGLRAGRANAQVLDRIAVDYYGSMTDFQRGKQIKSFRYSSLTARQTWSYLKMNSISSSPCVIKFFLPVSLKPIRR